MFLCYSLFRPSYGSLKIEVSISSLIIRLISAAGPTQPQCDTDRTSLEQGESNPVEVSIQQGDKELIVPVACWNEDGKTLSTN